MPICLNLALYYQYCTTWYAASPPPASTGRRNPHRDTELNRPQVRRPVLGVDDHAAVRPILDVAFPQVPGVAVAVVPDLEVESYRGAIPAPHQGLHTASGDPRERDVVEVGGRGEGGSLLVLALHRRRGREVRESAHCVHVESQRPVAQ